MKKKYPVPVTESGILSESEIQQTPTGLHIVQIKDWDKYVKAIGVLTKIGGTYAGRKHRTLIVTQPQYDALVQANLIDPVRQGR